MALTKQEREARAAQRARLDRKVNMARQEVAHWRLVQRALDRNDEGGCSDPLRYRRALKAAIERRTDDVLLYQRQLKNLGRR